MKFHESKSNTVKNSERSKAGILSLKGEHERCIFAKLGDEGMHPTEMLN